MAERPTPDATFKRWTGGVHGVQPTVFFGAPTGFAGMLAHARAAGARGRERCACVSSAGEALPAELGQRFKRHFGVDIVDGIGSTEMLHIFMSTAPATALRHHRLAGAGLRDRAARRRRRPRARRRAGRPLHPRPERRDDVLGQPPPRRARPSRAAGRRAATSTSATPTAPTPTAAAATTCSRSAASTSRPFEVEATLVQHPAVLEAAVIGVPDAEGLTKTKAFVVLKAGGEATDAELKAFVKDKLAPYKYPRQIEFVADLPKTATGKIQRFKLREQEARA
jgi:benzoate-CoA ligase